MTTLLLVRHGESEWNKVGRYQGHSDTSLSTTGVWQAERLRDRLAGQRIDAVYSSDLKRALDTAQTVVSKRNLVVVSCQELREISFGEFEGMTFKEIQQCYPGIKWWDNQNMEVNIPGGETVGQLASRVGQFVPRLSQHMAEDVVLVVAHYGSLGMLACTLLGIGIEHWWQLRLSSTSLTVVEVYPGATVLSLLNDTHHLESPSV